MTVDSTAHLLGQYAEGRAVEEAVAWFDEAGDLRVLVADLSDAKRIEVRRTKRGSSLTFTTKRPSPTQQGE
jgi:hypothetical protein